MASAMGLLEPPDHWDRRGPLPPCSAIPCNCFGNLKRPTIPGLGAIQNWGTPNGWCPLASTERTQTSKQLPKLNQQIKHNQFYTPSSETTPPNEPPYNKKNNNMNPRRLDIGEVIRAKALVEVVLSSDLNRCIEAFRFI